MTQQELDNYYNSEIKGKDAGALARKIYTIVSDQVTGGVVKHFNEAVNGYEVRDDIVKLSMLIRAYNDKVMDEELNVLTPGEDENFVKYNAADVLLFGQHKTVDDYSYGNNNFTWIDSSSCEVTTREGYSSVATAINYFDNEEVLPSYIVPGQTYRIYYSNTNSSPKVRFNITPYKNGQQMGTGSAWISSNTTYTVPSDAEGIRLRLYVNAGSAVNEIVTVKMIAGYSHEEILEEIETGLSSLSSLINSKFTDIQEETREQNGYSLTRKISRTDASHNGVSYQWTGESCEIDTNGSPSSAESVNIIYTNHTSFPPGLSPGGTYYAIAENFPENNIVFHLRFFDSEDEQISNLYFKKSGTFEIPSNAVGMLIRMYVSSGTIVDHRVVTACIATELSNSVLASQIEDLDTEINTVDKKHVAKRIYGASDVTTSQYWDISRSPSRQSNTFNPSNRVVDDDTTSSPLFGTFLTTFCKGDIIKLHTYAGANKAKPFALIYANKLIDKIYPIDYPDVSDSETEYNGTFMAEYNGWIAINTLVSRLDRFSCEIETSKDTFWGSAMLPESIVQDGYRGWKNYDDTDVCRVLNEGMGAAAMIHHWSIIGASFDSGVFNYSRVENNQTIAYQIEWYEHSCWEYFRHMNNIPDLRNYSNGGQNGRDWITLPKNANTTMYTPLGYYTGRAYEYTHDYLRKVPNIERRGIGPGGGCWWKMCEDKHAGKTFEAFVINLGSNDINNNWPQDSQGNFDPIPVAYDQPKFYTGGSIEDIGTFTIDWDAEPSDPDFYGYDTVPDGKTPGGAFPAVPGHPERGVVNSYAAYIGAIMNRLIAVQPNAIIFIATIRNGFSANELKYSIWNSYNDILRDIADMYNDKSADPNDDSFWGHVYIIDNGAFGPNYQLPPMSRMIVGSHPNAIGYKHLANVWNTLLDHAILTNYEDIKKSMFIGYDYTDENVPDNT